LFTLSAPNPITLTEARLITVMEAVLPATLWKLALKLRLPPPCNVPLMQKSWALADGLPITTIEADHRARVAFLMVTS
jgi:hypothetical protein